MASTTPPPQLPKPGKLKQVLRFPKWAWVVSGLPGVRIKEIKPLHKRWALLIAARIRQVYFPLLGIRVVLFSFLAFLICYFTPQRHSGLIHFFSITSSAAAIQVVTVIIGALSAVLAITFSVVLVVVGIVRKYAYRGNLSSIFGFYPLRELLLFYGFIIISSVYVLATTADRMSLRSIHLIYLEIYLFLVAIVALYPATKKLLDVTDPVTSVPRLVKEIKSSVSQFGRFAITKDSEVIPAEVAHPIFVLRDIAIKALSDNDEVTTIQIINQMSSRLGELINSEADPQNRRSIIDAFLLVWRSLMLRAVRLESEGVLFSLLDSIKDINASTSKRDFQWFEVLELNSFHVELIDKALGAGYEEVASRGVYLLGGIFEWNLSNIPPATELFMFADRKAQATFKSDTDKDLKWNHLAFDFVRLLSSAASTAIKNNNETVARDAISNLSGLIPKVAQATNLSDKQKSMIIAQISWNIRDSLIEAFEKMKISQSFLFIPDLHDFAHREVIDSNKSYSKFPIIFYKDIFRKAISTDQLSGYSLDSLRMVAYTLTDKLKKGKFDRVRKILIFLIILLDDVRDKTESRTSEMASECYTASYDKLKAIQKIVQDLHDDEIDNRIKESLKKYKNISQLKKTQNQYDDLW